jgi:hypothetical protein
MQKKSLEVGATAVYLPLSIVCVPYARRVQVFIGNPMFLTSGSACLFITSRIIYFNVSERTPHPTAYTGDTQNIWKWYQTSHSASKKDQGHKGTAL